MNAPFGYFFRKSSFSKTRISEEARAEAKAESQAEAQDEVQAEVQAEAQAEVQAEVQAESQAESRAESRAESQAEAQAESQSFSVFKFRYSIDAFIPKHSRTNFACFSTSSFFKSGDGLNHGTLVRLSMNAFTFFCTSFGKALPLSSLSLRVMVVGWVIR